MCTAAACLHCTFRLGLVAAMAVGPQMAAGNDDEGTWHMHDALHTYQSQNQVKQSAIPLFDDEHFIVMRSQCYRVTAGLNRVSCMVSQCSSHASSTGSSSDYDIAAVGMWLGAVGRWQRALTWQRAMAEADSQTLIRPVSMLYSAFK